MGPVASPAERSSDTVEPVWGVPCSVIGGWVNSGSIVVAAQFPPPPGGPLRGGTRRVALMRKPCG
eukprot:6053300-Pyramimonas_sp.AAC.1